MIWDAVIVRDEDWLVVMLIPKLRFTDEEMGNDMKINTEYNDYVCTPCYCDSVI
jgi:hypothetical protein